METPIFDFVQQYCRKDVARFHMPGHKGQTLLGCEPFDITEIAGADDLHHPEKGGVIARSEQNAATLFGTAQTCYSAGGSSACISAMLYLAEVTAPANRKGRVLAGRNAHKVFLQACALLDLQPEWLYPEEQNVQGICGCAILPEYLQTILAQHAAQDTLPCAVYLTSPDYLGNVADVAALSAVCATYDVPLLVDNAHGAYLKFLQPSCHPMDLGASICCDSAHKTLPVLTGGAYLHIAKGQEGHYPDAKAALSLFSSTSPSYLILQSLDLCNRYLAEQCVPALAVCAARLDALKIRLRGAGYTIWESEPLKLVVDCRAMAIFTGEALAQHLREQKVEAEFADPDFLVCMCTPQNTQADFSTLEKALLAALEFHENFDTGSAVHLPQLRPHVTTCTPRQALFARGETVAVEQAVGRTCRMPSVSCPPAIPIVVSGEVITQTDVTLFQYYGIETVNVITMV